MGIGRIRDALDDLHAFATLFTLVLVQGHLGPLHKTNRGYGGAIPLIDGMRERNELGFRILFRRKQLAVAEVHPGDATVVSPVVPRLDDAVSPRGTHGPAGDGLAEETGD